VKLPDYLQYDTALHCAAWAVQNDPEPFIPPLLEAGADINKQNRRGYSPLLTAIISPPKNFGTVDLSINNGANFEIAEYEGGQWRLLTVVMWKRPNYALIKACADCSATSLSGENILNVAARWADWATLEVLINYKGEFLQLHMNQRDKSGKTMLEYAEKRDDVNEKFINSSTIKLFNDNKKPFNFHNPPYAIYTVAI
jgi:ankyrin repeat protein